MTGKVRPANKEESAAVAALVNSAYRGESSRAGWTTEADLLGGQRTDPQAIEDLLSSPSNVILVMDHADRGLTGCVLLEHKGRGVAYLGMLTVAPDVQSGGVGKELLHQAEEFVRNKWGAQVVEMTVISRRMELIAWYHRRGYHRTGEKRPFPLDDPRFGLPLVAGLEFEVLRKYLGSTAGT